MKTDDLIRALTADTQRQRPLRDMLLLAMPVTLMLSVLALWLTLGFRADLLTALQSPLSLARSVLVAALGLLGLRIALVLARPEGRPDARFGLLVGLGCVALGLLAFAYVTTPPEARRMAVVGKTMTTCMVAIPALSVMPVAVMLAILRLGATTVPTLAASVVGLAGGGFGAAVYTLYCTEDSPLFYVTWYGLAIACVGIVSAMIGARVLRW